VGQARQQVPDPIGIEPAGPMGKFWIERWVWAPQSFSVGTSTVPMVSFSMRVLMV